MQSEAYFNLLRQMPVFGGLNDATLRLILDQSDLVRIAEGDHLFRQGDRAQSMFVLERGTAVVERVYQGTHVVLGRMQVGDCIGEMALIDLQPRSASVRAETDCQVIEISNLSLHKLYKQELEQYAIIMMNMGREVSRRLRKADERLLELEHKCRKLAI